MRFTLTVLTLLLTGMLTMSTTAASPVAIVIHAGAGGKARKMSPEKEKEYHDTLAKALRAGHAVLEKGGPAIEAVQVAIVVMEDSTLFNAGKGADKIQQQGRIGFRGLADGQLVVGHGPL